LKNLDPSHLLSICNLKMGDLFLTKENQHGRPPVVGFFEYMDGTQTVTRFKSKTAYFMPVQVDTVGIYFRKNVDKISSGYYWSKFHEVWIGGKKCVIHEDFIKPLPKGDANG